MSVLFVKATERKEDCARHYNDIQTLNEKLINLWRHLTDAKFGF